MSEDMNSQGSDSNEEDYDPNCEEEKKNEDPGDIKGNCGSSQQCGAAGADAFDRERVLAHLPDLQGIQGSSQ